MARSDTQFVCIQTSNKLKSINNRANGAKRTVTLSTNILRENKLLRRSHVCDNFPRVAPKLKSVMSKFNAKCYVLIDKIDVEPYDRMTNTLNYKVIVLFDSFFTDAAPAKIYINNL